MSGNSEGDGFGMTVGVPGHGFGRIEGDHGVGAGPGLYSEVKKKFVGGWL
jgi:hypothetical protein